MSIIIDGRRFNGRSFSLIDGVLTVDGVVVEGTLSGVVRIEVDGDLASLTTDKSVTCRAVHGNVTARMDVTCGDVGGNVHAGHGVTCGSVQGNVDAGHDVTCETVNGSVQARMGVTMRK